MTLAPITAAYAGALTVGYVALAFKVIYHRLSDKVLVGDGTKELNLLVLKEYHERKQVPTAERGLFLVFKRCLMACSHRN
jgi:hypothetical protein